MTLEQLRIFVAVAELEHMTRAAQSLNLTQSATSAAIAALETRYAVKLFNRIGRRIELTDAGRLFVWKPALCWRVRCRDRARRLRRSVEAGSLGAGRQPDRRQLLASAVDSPLSDAISRIT